MQARQIEIFATRDQRIINITSDAQTWGELKNHPEVDVLLRGSMSAVLKEGRHTLQANDALLPTESFTLFLIPLQQKAGVNSEEAEDLLDEINELERQFYDTINEIKKFVANSSDLSSEDLKTHSNNLIEEYNKIIRDLQL